MAENSISNPSFPHFIFEKTKVHILWVELCLPTEYGDIPTPSTSECGLIWKLGLYKSHHHQISMRSLGET